MISYNLLKSMWRDLTEIHSGHMVLTRFTDFSVMGLAGFLDILQREDAGILLYIRGVQMSLFV